MSSQHLIVGNSRDYHAAAVKWALERLGEEVIIWDGVSSTRDGQLAMSYPRAGLKLGGREFQSFRSIWFRRQVPYRIERRIDSDSLPFLKRELYDAHLSLGAILETMSPFLVGRSSFKNSSAKALQLKVAAELGFDVPETIISNDFEEVCDFARDKTILVKHFAPHYFVSRSTSTTRAIGPSRIESVRGLDRASVEVCPCIYQRLIEKSYELRVTVIGERIFTAKIDSADDSPVLDWRPEYGTGKVRFSSFRLETAVESRIQELVRALGLNYGCVDLAVDLWGNVYFLEINPGGQFLFVQDQVREYPLLLAFASMLAHGSSSFEIDEAKTADIDIEAFEASESCNVWQEKYEERKNDEKFVTFVD